MTPTQMEVFEARARKRARYLTGMLWHAGAFLIVNVFLWLIDLYVQGGGLDWAFWVTAAWGFGLAFHALAYFVDGRQVEERMIQRYVEEQTRREHQLQ